MIQVYKTYAATRAATKTPPMLPTLLLPAPVNAGVAGFVVEPATAAEVALAVPLAPLEMTVSAGAVHEVVGGEERVTMSGVETTVAGQFGQMTVEVVVVFAAALHVYAWKAVGKLLVL